jgi:hypothetical protein
MSAAPKGGKKVGGMPPQMGFLNPERPPQLAQKYANKLGKSCEFIAFVYTKEGVKVLAQPMGDLTKGGDPPNGISIADFQQRLAASVAPTEEQRLRSLRNKYELRLNKPFPVGSSAPASGKEADVQAWLDNCTFDVRRALLMSQKDFEKSFPSGFRASG